MKGGAVSFGRGADGAGGRGRAAGGALGSDGLQSAERNNQLQIINLISDQ